MTTVLVVRVQPHLAAYPVALSSLRFGLSSEVDRAWCPFFRERSPHVVVADIPVVSGVEQRLGRALFRAIVPSVVCLRKAPPLFSGRECAVRVPFGGRFVEGNSKLGCHTLHIHVSQGLSVVVRRMHQKGSLLLTPHVDYSTCNAFYWCIRLTGLHE